VHLVRDVVAVSLSAALAAYGHDTDGYFLLTITLFTVQSVKNNELIARPTMNLNWDELGRLYEQGN
jgi:hypothetical protein